jgi:hypothetical protein
MSPISYESLPTGGEMYPNQLYGINLFLDITMIKGVWTFLHHSFMIYHRNSNNNNTMGVTSGAFRSTWALHKIFSGPQKKTQHRKLKRPHQKIQWPSNWYRRTNIDLQNTRQNSKVRATRTPLKILCKAQVLRKGVAQCYSSLCNVCVAQCFSAL